MTSTEPGTSGTARFPHFVVVKGYHMGSKWFEGAFGAVLACTTVHGHERMAVKVVKRMCCPALREGPQEVTTLSRCDHPNVPKLLAVYSDHASSPGDASGGEGQPGEPDDRRLDASLVGAQLLMQLCGVPGLDCDGLQLEAFDLPLNLMLAVPATLICGGPREALQCMAKALRPTPHA